MQRKVKNMYEREYIRSLEVHIPLTCEVGTHTHTLETAIGRVGYMQQQLNMFAAFRVVGSCTDSRGIRSLIVKFLIYGRRDFKNALILLNWATENKYEVFINTANKKASLLDATTNFWRLLALSQMWFKDTKYDDEV